MSLNFSELAAVYGKLESISSGNEMRALLSNFFKKVPKNEIDIVAYLTLGRIGPEYEKIDLGIAEKMLVKAIAETYGVSEFEVTQNFKKKGDIGLVAEYYAGRKSNLTIKKVFDSLWLIEKAKGSGSRDEKISILTELLENSNALDAKYVCRIALGTLRLGAGAMTVLDSLSIAFTGSKASKDDIEHAYNLCSDIGLVAQTIALKGISGIKKFDVVLGRPVKMMLAQRINHISEIKERMNCISAEQKYDGERMQAHKDGNNVRIFSRRLDDITSQFPDIAEAIKKQIKAKKCIIEGECVAVKGDMLLPFQLLMQRRRKYDVAEYAKKIPTALFLFDILYLNGKSYIKEPYMKRTKALHNITKENNKIRLAKKVVSSNLEDVEDFFNYSVQHGGEGIIAKSCEGLYQAGTRGYFWIKWKKEYSNGMRETFDLVIVGAYHGKGTRSGVYGALLCAVYNRKNDEYETFCKVGSGFTGKQLSNFPKKLAKYKVSKPIDTKITKIMMPDVFFSPKVVIEVLGAEITKSPNHTCALNKYKNNGLALRFPRMIRFREDKEPEDATTSDAVIKMFERR